MRFNRLNSPHDPFSRKNVNSSVEESLTKLEGVTKEAIVRRFSKMIIIM